MRNSLVEVVESLAPRLVASLPAAYEMNPAYATGSGGLLCTLCALNAVRPDLVASRHVAGLYDAVCASVERESLNESLFSGVSGIAWILEMIPRHADVEAVDVGEVFTLLADMLSSRRGTNRVDAELVSGLAGIAFAASNSTHSSAMPVLEAVVGALEATSDSDEHGSFWRTASDYTIQFPNTLMVPGSVNFGLAHGVPGIVAVLSRLHGVELPSPLKARIVRLLRSAVAWLVANARLASCGMPSRFPPTSASPHLSTNLAWCYGDVGIGVALLDASTRLGCQEAGTLSRELIDHGSKACSVTTPGLCHGATSALLLHNALALRGVVVPSMLQQATEALSEADLGGEVDLSLLNGLSGIVGACVTAAYACEVPWDGPLMTGIR